MNLANALLWISPVFVITTVYFGIRKERTTIMTATSMTGMDVLTKGIVIFGATGDLCKR